MSKTELREKILSLTKGYASILNPSIIFVIYERENDDEPKIFC